MSAEEYKKLREQAERDCATWTPFTQNHDPDFQRWSRKCYVDGYLAALFMAKEKSATGSEEVK